MSTASSPPPSQTLVLIASDGKRVAVSRAIATEASYLLRDLLDGQDMLSPGSTTATALGRRDGGRFSDTDDGDSTGGEDNVISGGGPASAAPTACTTTTQSNTAPASAALPDLMDFFPSKPPAPRPVGGVGAEQADPSPTAGGSGDGNAMNRVHHGAASNAAPSPSAGTSAQVSVSPPPPPRRTPTAAHPTVPVPPSVVELPFPYFTGDILERVCTHMSYRFRTSTFASEDGKCRVFPVKMKEIPRPMTLPLCEYLDPQDRLFLSDWDEQTTVLMVKAATLLNYEELLQLSSAKLASFLCEKNVEGIRTLLSVEDDFSVEEQAELKKEHVAEIAK